MARQYEDGVVSFSSGRVVRSVFPPPLAGVLMVLYIWCVGVSAPLPRLPLVVALITLPWLILFCCLPNHLSLLVCFVFFFFFFRMTMCCSR